MINFYPSKLQKTRQETIGNGYKWAKRLMLIGIAVSGALFAWVSAASGFFTLLASSLLHEALLGREYYIDSIYKIRATTDLRLRLLQLQDSEYALESLNKDAEWRGEAPDPEVTERLEEIRRNKAEFKSTIQKFLDEITKGASISTPVDTDDKKPN